ncbi:hypothetical protein M8C13_08890 [Crossiella sp. SN42]|uniref:hypothetical protein n=1 Tax=Crossiella sp. SN42 TaxID=2944808 RepID=UPI00207C555D|nr:hypothetical protein [Crossiella sp. SN42]MCO1575872.1 hypothetical protein [Crossiella sp. SN42]
MRIQHRYSPTRYAVALLATAVSVGTVAGCDQQVTSRSAPRSTSTAEVTRPMPSGSSAQQQVLAAYNGMWSAMSAAAESSDPTAPALSRHATDFALDKITRGLRIDNDNGVVTRGAVKTAPTITELTPPQDPREARVADCGDDGETAKYTRAGARVPDSNGGRRKIQARLKLVGDRWLVTDFAMLAVGSC